jgi:phosphoribosyl-AMP cyclohydrolase
MQERAMDIDIELTFDEKGLIPAIIQDHGNHQVLMMAYMNEESLKKTLETGLTHFWSRSRGVLWKKGETSGHLQRVKEAYYDCDSDTLLFRVEQTGAACHTGNRSCFYRKLASFSA